MKYSTGQFAFEICKALGLDERFTKRLVLDFEVGNVLTVTVYQFRVEDEELVDVVRRFALSAVLLDEAPAGVCKYE